MASQDAPTRRQRYESCWLPEGYAELGWPEPLSAESLEDMKEWLALAIRKLERRFAEQAERME